jgi:tetratricopeptide (TPR) repeat protein
VQGDLDRAEPIYRRAIELENATIGPDHPEHAATLSSFGALLCDKKDFAAAEPVLRDALRIRRATFSSGDSRVLRTQGLLAETLSQLKRFDEAAAEFQSAIAVIEAGGADPDGAAKLCQRAAEFFERRGDTTKAEHIRSLVRTGKP